MFAKIDSHVKFTWLFLFLGLGIVFIPYIFLLNPMWDSWIYFFQVKEHHFRTLLAMAKDIQHVFYPIVLTFFGSFPGVMGFRIGVIFFGMGSGILFYLLLKVGFRMERTTAALISVFSSILPFNLVHFELLLAYFSLFCFFIALWIIAKNLGADRLKLTLKTKSLLYFLFFAAFYNGSLLFFYAIFPLLVAFNLFRIAKHDGASYFRTWIHYLKFNWEMFLLPIFFWILRRTVFPSYLGYQDPSFDIPKLFSILHAPIDYFWRLYDVLMQFDFRNWWFYVFLSGALVLLYKSGYLNQARSFYQKLLFILVGFIFLYLGIAPYILVNKTIAFTDWGSRDHMIVGYGCAMIIVGAIQIFFGHFAGRMISLFVASAFIAQLTCFWLDNIQGWIVDDLKQLSLIYNLRQDSDAKISTIIIFDDQATRYAHLSRETRFYEYSGLLKTAFGEEARLGFSSHDEVGKAYIKKFQEKSLGNSEAQTFLISGFKGCGREVVLNVEIGWYHLSEFVTGYLLRRHEWDADFRERLRKGLKVYGTKAAEIKCT